MMSITCVFIGTGIVAFHAQMSRNTKISIICILACVNMTLRYMCTYQMKKADVVLTML